MKTKILSMVIVFTIVLFLVSCGAKTIETTTQISDQTTEEAVPVITTTQPVLEEEGTGVEEKVVVDVSSDSVSVDLEQNNEESQTIDESTETFEVKIEDYTFGDAIITVNVGDTVVWENYDSAPHTVTGGGLDSGKMSKGDTYEYTFTESGTYKYYCAYHPSMTAKVIVEQ